MSEGNQGSVIPAAASSNSNANGSQGGTQGGSGSDGSNRGGRGRRNGGGRSRGGRSGNDPGQVMSNAKTFHGDIEDLKGHIYDCVSPTDADRYLKTTTKVQEYIGRVFTFGELLSPALESPKDGIPKLMVPVVTYADPGKPTEIEKLLLTEEVKIHIKKKSSLEENNRKLFSVVKGQCTDAMLARIEGHDNYASSKNDRDGLALLAIVKSISYAYQHKEYVPLALHKTMHRFYNFKQKKDQTVTQYKEAFTNNVDVIEAQGSLIGTAHRLLDYVTQTKTLR